MPVKPTADIEAEDLNNVGFLTAGEDIDAGEALALTYEGGVLVDGASQVSQNTTEVHLSASGVDLYSQSFVTGASTRLIKSITVKVGQNEGSNFARPVYVAVRATKDGANIASGATGNIASSSGATTTYEATVELNAQVDPSTTYYIIVSGYSGSYLVSWAADSTGPYASGSAEKKESGSWSAVTGDFYFSVIEGVGLDNEVFLAGAENFDGRLNFIGFAIDAATAGNPVKINSLPSVRGLSGLTSGSVHYLSDTPGALATTPGTYEREVGLAVSTSALIRKRGVVSPPLTPVGTIAPTDGYLHGQASGTVGAVVIDGITLQGDYAHGQMIRRTKSWSTSSTVTFVIIDGGSFY